MQEVNTIKEVFKNRNSEYIYVKKHIKILVINKNNVIDYSYINKEIELKFKIYL